MDIEWDRCYQAIEMLIENTYLELEKEQVMDDFMAGKWDYLDCLESNEDTKDPLDYYNETYKV